ncbi:hypothetical protein D9M69_390170 [compost metagenome]
MADVEVEVEQVVLDPVRIAEAEGHLDDPALEHRRHVEAFRNMPDDLAEAEALTLHRGLVVDVDHGAMRRRMGTIDFQEHGVLPAEFAHREALARLWLGLDDWLNHAT